jgi:hypothetical protein
VQPNFLLQEGMLHIPLRVRKGTKRYSGLAQAVVIDQMKLIMQTD